MPHRAMMLMQVNETGRDPEALSANRDAIARATSITELVQSLGLDEDSNLLEAAGAVDSHLPSAVTNAILGAYRAAAESNTDGVQVTWRESGGFGVEVSHAPGTDAHEDRGFISVAVRSPRLS